MIAPKQINQQEYIDSPDVPLATRQGLLTEIDHMNKRLGIYTDFKRYFSRFFLNKFAQKISASNQKLKILEVGCGNGELAVEMIQYLTAQGINVDYHVVEIDQNILEWAQQNCKGKGAEISTHLATDQYLKVFTDQQFDVVISLHVLHHIYPSTVLKDMLAQSLRISKYGIFMADYDRRYGNELISNVICFFLGISRTLHQDGITSVRRAYTTGEMMNILKQVGEGFTYKIHRLWLPYQIVCGYRKPPETI